MSGGLQCQQKEVLLALGENKVSLNQALFPRLEKNRLNLKDKFQFESRFLNFGRSVKVTRNYTVLFC